MTNPEPPILKTSRFDVRLAKVSEAALIARYVSRNADHFRKSGPARPDPFFKEGFWSRQLAANLVDFERRTNVRLFAFSVNEEFGEIAVAAHCNLTQVSWGTFRAAFLGYGVCETWQGKGAMFEVTQAVCAFAFDLGLHRIQANYMPTNTRSGSLLRRLGFVVEGYARDYLLIDGQWEDHVLTSLTAPTQPNSFN